MEFQPEMPMNQLGMASPLETTNFAMSDQPTMNVFNRYEGFSDQIKLTQTAEDKFVVMFDNSNKNAPQESFICNICGVAASSSRLLEDHMVAHYEWKNLNIRCGFCNINLENPTNLSIHLFAFHNMPRGVESCVSCGIHFARKELLTQHVHLYHQSKVSPNSNSLCQMYSSNTHPHEKYLPQKTPRKWHKVICPVCQKEMLSSRVYLHMKTDPEHYKLIYVSRKRTFELRK